MDVQTNNIDVLTLAYLGDAVYEVYIRENLINKNICKIDQLQKQAICYVSAYGQVKFLNYLINNNVLTESEFDIVKRGRNNKRSAHPKNTDILTYKHATGLEALIGYLYLSNQNRLKEILAYVWEV